jgi:hypothetical protein
MEARPRQGGCRGRTRYDGDGFVKVAEEPSDTDSFVAAFHEAVMEANTKEFTSGDEYKRYYQRRRQ